MPGDGISPAQAAPAARRLSHGDSVGRYVILDVLGQGSMGVVYVAYDPQLDRGVAMVRLWLPRSDGEARVNAPPIRVAIADDQNGRIQPHVRLPTGSFARRSSRRPKVALR